MGVKVIIRDVYHDYFQRGGDRISYLKFDNLLEGWREYKRMKSHEFNYGNAWYEEIII